MNALTRRRHGVSLCIFFGCARVTNNTRKFDRSGGGKPPASITDRGRSVGGGWPAGWGWMAGWGPVCLAAIRLTIFLMRKLTQKKKMKKTCFRVPGPPSAPPRGGMVAQASKSLQKEQCDSRRSLASRTPRSSLFSPFFARVSLFVNCSVDTMVPEVFLRRQFLQIRLTCPLAVFDESAKDCSAQKFSHSLLINNSPPLPPLHSSQFY